MPAFVPKVTPVSSAVRASFFQQMTPRSHPAQQNPYPAPSLRTAQGHVARGCISHILLAGCIPKTLGLQLRPVAHYTSWSVTSALAPQAVRRVTHSDSPSPSNRANFKRPSNLNQIIPDGAMKNPLETCPSYSIFRQPPCLFKRATCSVPS